MKTTRTKRKQCGETVLVALVSAAQRSKMARTLEGEGYRVYLATSGNEALEIWKIASAQIDLLVVDLKMPGMSGVELAQVLRALRNDLKVLFTGGAADALRETGLTPEQGRHILKRPYRKKALLEKIRIALDDAG